MDQNFGDFTHVAVSAESGQSGSPSGGPFLFQEYLTSANLMQQGAMTFGHLGSDGGDRALLRGWLGFGVLLRELAAGGSEPDTLASSGTPLPELSRRHLGPTGGGQFRTRQHDNAGCPRKRDGQAGSMPQVGVRSARSPTYLLVLEPDGISVHHRDVGTAERRLQEQVQGVLRRLTPAPACRHNSRPPPVQVAGAFVAGSSSIGRRCPRTCPR